MALHPVKRIDVIEIEPAVVEAAAFFAKENREVLKNPKARVAIVQLGLSLAAWTVIILVALKAMAAQGG